MMEESRTGFRSVLANNGSGCGSGRSKNIRIRIHNTATKHRKLFRYFPVKKKLQVHIHRLWIGQ
jgi:hypothetical protein